MPTQSERLEAATIKAEVGSGILYKFANDAVGDLPIPTLANPNTPNLQQVILQIQQDGENKISFATKIYATTAAGIAGTANGEIFLVQSAGADEIYAVYKNNAGTAQDTGKRSLSAAAVTAAVTSATEAADAAQDAADAATMRVASFHSPSANNPTTRDDGTALQIGDTYFNTTSQAGYVYKTSGWQIASVDGDALATKQDTLPDGTATQFLRGSDKTFVSVTKANVGLPLVDNVADVNKPVSGPQQTALDAKEPTIASGTSGQYFDGTKTFKSLNKAAVGLPLVDNTPDSAKPVSSAQQAALDAKASTTALTTGLAGKEPTIAVGTSGQYWDGTKTFKTLDKTAVGLPLVDNTPDSAKPVSTPQQTALDAKVATSALAASTGSSLVGFAQAGTGAATITAQQKMRNTVSPRDFGAVGDNVTDDFAAITAAITYLVAAGGGTLDFGSLYTTYRISKPIRLYPFLNLIGSARIAPTSGFTNVSFPTYQTNVPQVYSCLAFYKKDGFADDPTSANVGGTCIFLQESIRFDGEYHANATNGLILEGLENFSVKSQFTRFASLGIWLKLNCYLGSVRSYVTNCRDAFIKLGPASNAIDLNGFKGYGLNDTPGYGVIIQGDNNGINLSGACLEKTKGQVICLAGAGPMTISGCDFEVCQGTSIEVDGSSLTDRVAGPITITGCFLEATVSAVKATNALVIVQGCRIRNTPLAFNAVGANSTIYDIANVVQSTVTTLAAGNVISDQSGAQVPGRIYQAPYTAAALGNVTIQTTRAYPDAPTSATHAMVNQAAYVDPSTKRMLTKSIWIAREMRNGAVYGEMGLSLDYSAGNKTVTSYSVGDTSLGTKANPFASVFAKSLVQCAGVAVGVNPATAGELVIQFTSNTTITFKGMGTDGVVRVANITLA